MTTTAKNRIMIFGPKYDGTYVVEFMTAVGETLAIESPRLVHQPRASAWHQGRRHDARIFQP
jgi:hypothetical protein